VRRSRRRAADGVVQIPADLTRPPPGVGWVSEARPTKSGMASPVLGLASPYPSYKSSSSRRKPGSTPRQLGSG
jgi:hypothetical protein